MAAPLSVLAIGQVPNLPSSLLSQGQHLNLAFKVLYSEPNLMSQGPLHYLILAHQPDWTPWLALCPAHSLSLCALAHAALSSTLPTQILPILWDAAQSPPRFPGPVVSLLSLKPHSTLSIHLFLYYCDLHGNLPLQQGESLGVRMLGPEFFHHSTSLSICSVPGTVLGMGTEQWTE